MSTCNRLSTCLASNHFLNQNRKLTKFLGLGHFGCHGHAWCVCFSTCLGCGQCIPIVCSPINEFPAFGFQVLLMYIGIYIYICMYIYISGERVWSPQCFCWLECAQCVYSWTLMVSGDLWNVHNFCDTCTTSVTRAQYLWNVHNISDTCTTSLKRTHIIPLSWSSIKCRCFDSIKCCSGTHFIEDWLGRL